MPKARGTTTRPTALRKHKRNSINVNREDPLYAQAQDPRQLLEPENLPDPPADFESRHKKFYKAFAYHMREYRLLTEQQLYLLQQLAWYAGEAEYYRAHVAKHGHVSTGRLGRGQSPESKLLASLTKQLVFLMHEAGFTPAGASQVKPSRVANVEPEKGPRAPGKHADPFSEFAP